MEDSQAESGRESMGEELRERPSLRDQPLAASHTATGAEAPGWRTTSRPLPGPAIRPFYSTDATTASC